MYPYCSVGLARCTFIVLLDWPGEPSVSGYVGLGRCTLIVVLDWPGVPSLY